MNKLAGSSFSLCCCLLTCSFPLVLKQLSLFSYSTQICPDHMSYYDLTMYVIKGSDDFEDWRSSYGKDNSGVQASFSPSSSCSPSKSNIYSFTVSDADDYYFVLLNEGSSMAVDLTLEVMRTQYPISEADTFCQSPCRITAAVDSPLFFVVGVSPSPGWYVVFILLLSAFTGSIFHNC